MLALRIIPNKSKETKMKQVLKNECNFYRTFNASNDGKCRCIGSVKPLGFITSSIANGVTDTQVLVPAGASPHDYS